MKCLSRSTLGVVVGVLNILLLIAASIISIMGLVQIKYMEKIQNELETDSEHKAIAKIGFDFGTTMLSIVLVACIIMIVLAALLIAGIVKRRHSLMVPWLILAAIGFVCNCIRLVIGLIGGISYGVSFNHIIISFLLNALALVIQGLVLYPIYTLYRDIRKKNNEHPGQIVNTNKMEFDNAYPVHENEYNVSPPKY